MSEQFSYLLGLPSRARDSENVQEDLAVSVSSIVADLDNVAMSEDAVQGVQTLRLSTGRGVPTNYK